MSKDFQASLTRWADRHSMALVTVVLLLITVFLKWRGYVQVHEAMYFLGPHRVVDPELLGEDLSWGRLPPTTFLYDHLLAPLWNSVGDLGIAALGRLLFWGLTAWSLALLGRLMRIPWWAVVAGYLLWLLSGQTLVSCGRPIEGFQPKALSYPLFYFSLAFAMQGQPVRAGMASGLATLFHIVVGGWGCMAVFCAMLLSRVPRRQVLLFLAATAPFILPLLIAVARFNAGQGTAEERALMDRLYVTFAAPHCCDLSFLMSRDRWFHTIIVFVLTPILLYIRARDPNSRMGAHFVSVLIGVYVLGLAAQYFKIYAFLKVFPFQLANAIPLLFLFILVVACMGREKPRRLAGKVVWVAGMLVGAWIMYQEDAADELVDAPGSLVFRVNDPTRAMSYGNRAVPMDLYQWIREETPKDAVFVTPHLGEFWVLAERAQVASMRHPPIDRGIIEWEQRLLALNRNKPFEQRGFDISKELTRNEGRLRIPELIALRDRYGATHYLSERTRKELAEFELFTSGRYHVYALADLEVPESEEEQN